MILNCFVAVPLLGLFSSPCFALDVSLEEKLLGTIPADLELEGEPVTSPDGQVFKNVQSVAWSPDGTQVAYTGMRGALLVPVIGNETFGEYHYANSPIFGATGEQLVFRVGNRKKNGKSEDWWLLTHGGKEVFEEDWIGTPAFSPDGTQLATWIQPGAKIAKDGSYTRGSMVFMVASLNKGKWKFSKGKKHDDASALKPPIFAADGSLAATVASKQQRWFALTSNGKREKPFDKEDFTFVSDIAISPDGKELALSVMNDNWGDLADLGAMAGMQLPGRKNIIMRGENALGKDYDSAGVPVFSPDGKHLAYKIRRGVKMGIALNDDTHANAEWDFVFAPVFSPDSKRFCYVANSGGKPSPFFSMLSEGDYYDLGGKNVLVVEDSRTRKDPETLTDEYLEIRDAIWDAEGERIAFRGKTDKGWIAVCGKTRSEPYDELSAPQFSTDGKQLAFGARSGRELWWKVITLE